jgi:type II secretory pathway component GspD/PulD (secretin)
VQEGNIIKILSKASIAAEPLKEEIITLIYTTAAEVEKVIRPFLTPGRGSATSDTRSNTIVLSDLPARLLQIKEIVNRLDTQTPQVMIEARVLETSKNPKQDYGIKWDSLVNYEFAAKNIGFKFNPRSGAVGFYPGGSKDAPINSAEVAVLSASDFRILLSFLNSNGETELLASPRIVTADNKEARINIAQQFPIPQFTFNQQTASLEVSGFTFKDIGILLGVTPHINKSGFITLELKPEISSFDPTKNQHFGGAVNAEIPVINTRNIQASVLIKDGHTLALGGLIQEDVTRAYTKVPIMGDIPGLGAAFRSRSFTKNKRNLLIFITPTLVGPEGSTGLEDQYNGVKTMPEDDFAHPEGWHDNALSKCEQKARKEESKSEP